MKTTYKRLAAAFLVCSLSSACVTSVSSLQNARALEPGEVQVTAALQASVPTATIGKAVDAIEGLENDVKQASDDGTTLSEETERQFRESGIAYVLFAPGTSTELLGRVGVVKNVDLGVRYAGQLIKGDAKYQFHDNGNSAASVSLGYAHHRDIGSSVLSSAFGVAESLKIADYARKDIDLTVTWGQEKGEWLKYYFAGRYIASLISIGTVIDDTNLESEQAQSDLDSTIHHIGGTAGVMLGYKVLFVNLELNALYVAFAPTILGEEVDLSGMLIAPTVGLTAQF